MTRAARLRVLQSFPALNDTTNPYVTQLVHSLSARGDVALFSWPDAFRGRYDLLHVHWPERMLRGTSTLRSAARSGLFVALMIITRLRGQAVVRTLHNDAPHEPGSRLERFALRVGTRRVDHWILLNDVARPPTDVPSTVIRHGHYRHWLAGASEAALAPEPGRLLFFGLVRRYKGIDELLRAFAGLEDGCSTLRVIGRTVDDDTAAIVSAAAAREGARVFARLEFVPDAELVAELAASQLVVLPYRRMNNSGAALLALSAGRPVLVPDNEVTRSLADEVGPGWVLRFPGVLNSVALADAVARTTTMPVTPPDLSRREWDDAARAHCVAYRSALARCRLRRSQ